MRTMALRPAAAEPRAQFWHGLGQAAGLVSLLRQWRERSRGRAELARLDPRMLADIGVTGAEAWAEINKPFWRE